ncbi:LytR C-terminal domain-containing protein [Actinotignum sp. GS-2025a]|uniref:LytR C-terminal domain-containing protein n=1 Tax=Actinotignum sp. GS-2025a TaxID=3427274 RepID=UPI003F470936
MAGKYPVDEFDIAARQRTTRGAHRKRESSAKWWIALIAILILAPALGYGIVKMNQISVAPPSHKPSVSAPAQPSATAPEAGTAGAGAEGSPAPASEAPAPAEEASPSASPTPAAEVDHSRSTLILNASGISGYAAAHQRQLTDAGFTTTSIGNYQHAAPAHSQIFYPAAADLPTVEAIGAELGITDFVENASASGDSIVVVLAGDTRD